MKVRKLAGALLAGGVLAAVSLSASPASAQPYPPGPCSGTAGVGFVSEATPVIGSEIRFSACGFSPLGTVVVTVTGSAPFGVRADATGFITTLVRLTTLGTTTISAVGTAGFPTGVGAPVGELRTVLSTLTVVSSTASGGGAGGAGGGPGGVNGAGLVGPGAPGAGGHALGLPFTGAESGALAGLALALTGGGVALRVAARRRRAAASGPREEG